MQKKFDVIGMTCTACSTHVEKAVQQVPGVQKVKVNLILNSMLVDYDERHVKEKDIEKAVQNAGYQVKNTTGEKIGENELKNMKKRLIISVLFLIPLMYLAMSTMSHNMFALPTPKWIQDNFYGAQNALTNVFTQFLLTIPILYVNRKYFIVGFQQLIKRTPNMDSLIAIGASAAMIYGVVSIYTIGIGLASQNLEIVQNALNTIYFESAGMILTLITVGKYLETKSKGKTNEAVKKLLDLAPKYAIILSQGQEKRVPVEQVKIGDTVIIKPGNTIPVDGKILEGNTSIDQSILTGESIPVEKGIGDPVIGGAINKLGYLKIEATKVGEETTLAQIIKLVENASASKAPIAKLADKISGIFVPTVIIIALISLFVWLILGESFPFALSIAIAVLVISCPCALGLATPVSIMVGTGKGAEHGILIKEASSLEQMRKVDTIVLDKTGTVTEGKPKVTDIITETISRKELLKIAASIEKRSEHILATAILEQAEKENVELEEVQEFRVVPGKGIIAQLGNQMYLAGNQTFLMENNISLEKQNNIELAKQGKTILYFATPSKLIGEIAVADPIRESSKKAIEELLHNKKEVVLLTGDNSVTAQAVKEKLNIPTVIAEVLPQQKEEKIRELQEQGKIVAMVGDGINDSPALARADIGIAIGAGTDIAIEAANIVLVKNNLMDVVTTIQLSDKVVKNIKMNLFWAFFYNSISIPVAAGILYIPFGITLNPMIAAAAMSLSSVCVVLNALRLRNFKTEDRKEEEQIMQKVIKINGMSCNHCKMSVEKAISQITGVQKVEVNLEEKSAIVILEQSVEDERLKQAIEEQGFEVVTIE